MNEFTLILVENLAEIVSAAIGLVFSAIVLPWVRNTAIPWLKEKQLFSRVYRCVKAVEKMAESGAIEKIDKKKHAIKLLENMGVTVDENVDAMIEAAVIDLDIALMKGFGILEGVLEEAVEVETEVDAEVEAETE